MLLHLSALRASNTFMIDIRDLICVRLVRLWYERASRHIRLPNGKRMFGPHNLVYRLFSDELVEETLVHLTAECRSCNSTVVCGRVADVHYLRVSTRCRAVNTLRNLNVEQLFDEVRAYCCFSNGGGEDRRIMIAKVLSILRSVKSGAIRFALNW